MIFLPPICRIAKYHLKLYSLSAETHITGCTSIVSASILPFFSGTNGRGHPDVTEEEVKLKTSVPWMSENCNTSCNLRTDTRSRLIFKVSNNYDPMRGEKSGPDDVVRSVYVCVSV